MWTSPPTAGNEKRHDPFYLYRLAHQALRGRYLLLIFLALAGAAVGGYVSYSRQKPLYRSEGMLRIAFQSAPLSGEAEKAREREVFQEFLQSQLQVMTSRPVIEKAVRRWTGHADGENEAQRANRFAGSLTVLHPLDSEHFAVTFTDTDPSVAASGVKELLNAYIEYRETEVAGGATVTPGNHEDGKPDFQREMNALQAMEKEIGRQFDPTEPTSANEGSMQQSGKTVDELVNRSGGLDGSDHKPETPLTLNQIGILDPLMRQYLEQQAAMVAELDHLRAAGAMDANPHVALMQRELALQNEMMEKYAEDYRRFQISTRNPLSPVSAGSVDVRHRLAELRLTEVDRQMTDLRTNGTFAGKAQVVSSGIEPQLPYADPRLKAALAGGAAGAALPAAALVLLGLLHKRLRSPDDVVGATGAPPLLGILPQLPKAQLSQDRKAVWAFCVHQVRVLLQARHERNGSRAYLVTSASPGEGKTRLTIALGKSFAQSGSRTLLVDCDVIAQGLTRRLRVRPDRDLTDGLRAGTPVGFFQRIDETGLAVLPVRGDVDADRLSTNTFRRLLNEARRHFDVILIDSGCVLGSVEASLLAPEVDGVILTVTRGQQQPLVERSIRHLEGVGAKIVGTVFNRARFSNLQTSAPNPPAQLPPAPPEPVKIEPVIVTPPPNAPAAQPESPARREVSSDSSSGDLIIATGAFPTPFAQFSDVRPARPRV